MIEDAEMTGLLRPYTGSRIFEGTVGSTGISIATLAKARYVFFIPHPSFVSTDSEMEVVMMLVGFILFRKK